MEEIKHPERRWRMKKQSEMMTVVENLLDLHPFWSATQIAAEASRVVASIAEETSTTERAEAMNNEKTNHAERKKEPATMRKHPGERSQIGR
jgi:hypothetical protein